NASGTAGLLEMAEAFSRARPGPARSVLFIAFSGEEMGLLGSAHYVKEPLLPLDKTVAMVNLDMVGRLRDDKLIVGGVDTGSGLRDLVNEKAGPLGLSVAGSGDGFGASDHASFYGKKVPVLFFFTGVHDDYHRPTDDVEKVNFPGAEKVVRLAYRCSWKLASGGARPEYQETTNPHLRAAAGAGSGFGAYLGTVPDYTQSEKGGVTLQAVRPGSPAEAAGLKAGDVIVAFAGAPIDNVYDYTYALREHKPGETVALTVKRGGESLTLTARLAQRP
ncbi:MAG: M28 family peptidase, partial [Planctomycetes bacterium]|nr:M28 family peptidase [Planctomycetota bacterium]